MTWNPIALVFEISTRKYNLAMVFEIPTRKYNLSDKKNVKYGLKKIVLQLLVAMTIN